MAADLQEQEAPRHLMVAAKSSFSWGVASYLNISFQKILCPKTKLLIVNFLFFQQSFLFFPTWVILYFLRNYWLNIASFRFCEGWHPCNQQEKITFWENKLSTICSKFFSWFRPVLPGTKVSQELFVTKESICEKEIVPEKWSFWSWRCSSFRRSAISTKFWVTCRWPSRRPENTTWTFWTTPGF